MSDKDWLQNLKVGDKVIEDRGYQGKDISVVDRFTKTLVIVKNPKGYEARYRKEDGFNPGDHSYACNLIREATPERLAEIAEKNYRAVFQNKLSHLSWADVPLETIKQIRELVEPYIRKEPKNV